MSLQQVDRELPINWLEKAADGGVTQALCELAELQHRQEALEQARASYAKAAQQGDRMAQYRMGTLREKGLGAPRNRVHAYTWLSLAATEGMPKALQARDELEAAMTKPEVKQAQKLSEYWFSKIASAVRNG